MSHERLFFLSWGIENITHSIAHLMREQSQKIRATSHLNCTKFWLMVGLLIFDFA
jgi:hypothetical protein